MPAVDSNQTKEQLPQKTEELPTQVFVFIALETHLVSQSSESNKEPFYT